MLNYTGVFLEDGKHMTWNYGFPLEYPKGVKAGDKVTLTVVGNYEDDEVSCMVVRLGVANKQPKGTLLHITTKVAQGAKPVMSGLRATEKGFDKVKPYTIEGKWK